PIEGLLKGVTIEAPNGKIGGIDYKDIFSFGEDAVMANADSSVVPLEKGWVENHSHAKKHLLGTNVITEGGKLLGQIGNIYVRLMSPPIAIYEIRESVLDKLLGRNVFIFASAGTALSSNAERIVVPDNVAAEAAPSLTELMNRTNQPAQRNSAVIQNPDDEEEHLPPR
ncbi:MAG TPA: hypothetical protein VK892_14475, partial [Pyrinomonadaceae bacterium]|nr:hypothetical protein [Pyrinomonadaceae bacterium]